MCKMAPPSGWLRLICLTHFNFTERLVGTHTHAHPQSARMYAQMCFGVKYKVQLIFNIEPSSLILRTPRRGLGHSAPWAFSST